MTMSKWNFRGSCQNGMQKRKRCCIILMVFALFFIAFRVYLNRGYWDIDEYTTGVCSEASYHFNDDYLPKPDVFRDQEHFRRCRASFERRKPRKYGPEDTFYIKTKCGYAVPVLMSRKERKVKLESGDYVVPNIVHYVIFAAHWEMDFLNYLSFLSASKFIKPDHIFIHGNVVPSGQWWNRTIQEVPNIYYVYREQPMRIQGRKIHDVRESSNILRLQTVLGKIVILIHHEGEDQSHPVL